ncbi:Ig-like domain-containing protein [Enterobacter sp. SLBN-59]|uniref:Ig-like domain-containing protein n=1 Tax=Enterobacter sp. SLBN-59 TaxID=2940621 RepID=UPI00216718AC|nr:invasin domain 3-containing protein [Enterobacter sp. SLBN-59]MCS3490721.1 adhesin/invasin [Enterobacter sp. SLBN-59]
MTDAKGNPVPGVKVTFSAGNDVPVTAVNDGTTDGNGLATATLTNTKAGVTTVSATIGDSSQTVDTTFVADTPDSGRSSLTATPDTITANGTDVSAVTLTLKDAHDNAVSGQTVTFASSLAGTRVGDVTDNGNGTYTADLTGTAAGETSVTATVGGSAFGVAAAKVTLTSPSPEPVPESTTLAVNGATFAASSHFPTTGFTGAKFQVLLSGSASNNSNYNWSADQGWVSVDASGNVSFTGTATSGTKTVTITATPKAGGAPLTYTFTVSKWFVNNRNNTMNWGTADEYCSFRGGLPTVADLTSVGSTRGVGSLWAEWGRLDTAYSGSGFLGSLYWTSADNGAGYYYYVNLGNGGVGYSYDTSGIYVVCRQDL